MKSLFVQI
jgi:NADH-quinone oxidoreductase subunit N